MAETWRVVLASGEVREVEVSRAEASGMLSPVRPWHGWRAARTWDGPVHAASEAMGDSAEEACARLAVGNGLAAREILAPGEPTRAELIAQRDETRAEVERLRAESEERLRTIQRVAEAVAAEPPMDLVARVRWQVAEVERLRHRLGRVIVATDHIPQHLGATWWGQRLRAALVPPATEVPDDRARGTGGAT